jgi:hypothetical protein
MRQPYGRPEPRDGPEVLSRVDCGRQWSGKPLIDRPRLCAAIVDRLTFGGSIIETGTDSYRLAHTRRLVDVS